MLQLWAVGTHLLMTAYIYQEWQEKVYLIHRSNNFKAEEKLVNRVKQIAKEKGNIEFVLFNEVKQIIGKDKVEAI